MALVALAAMVPVTAMMSANLNSSQMVEDRRAVQDAADTLAVMHATWSARALNIISMNNVTTAQLLSVAVGSEALLAATTELSVFAALATTHILSHEATHCPPRSRHPVAAAIEAIIWSAPCVAWHTAVNLPAALAAARAADIKDDFDPAHGIETATRALKAIDGMNRELARRHPRAMAEIAEDYRAILEIDDHHFADPCRGAGASGCARTNTGDGMALPLEPAGPQAHARLFQVMMTGTTAVDTTFWARGFQPLEGPLTHGGSARRPHLRDHINHVTEIGTALYEFKRFYDSRIAHLPRHPAAGPGNAIGSGYTRPGEPPDEETPFDGDTGDMLDSLVDILDGATDITESVLRVLRNLPLAFDRHPAWANFPDRQSRRGPNAFTRHFTVFHGLVMAPGVRPNIPVGTDRFRLVFAAPVPETWQLADLSQIEAARANETADMPDAYRILAYAQREKSPRLADRLRSPEVAGHTGYAQAGIYNPDGATLFSQNWRMRLMPATRMDDPAGAAARLDREARQSFDELAETLRAVRSGGSWGRVNAH